MKVKTNELKEILKGLQPGIAQKAFVEQSSHYVFTGNRLCSYNDKVSVSYPFETNFQCSIPSDSFYKVVSKLTSDEVKITFSDNELRLTSPKVKSGFSCLVGGEIIELLESLEINEDWKPVPKDFLKGIELCLFSASTDLTQKFLSSICVRENKIESSDDVRISCYTMEKSILDSFLLPVSSAKDLVKYNITHYSLTNGWVHFRLESNGIFSSRLIFEDYPETSPFFNVEGIELDLTPELSNSVEMVSVLSEGDFDLDKRIVVNIAESSISCKGENESGWIEKIIPFNYNGEKASFIINPLFLMQILEKSRKMVLTDDRVLFKSKSFDHVMALQI